MRKLLLIAFAALVLPTFAATESQAEPQNRQLLFGETHVHTLLSFDSYIFGNRNTPDDAYRYAKGEVINHPAGFEMALKTPLDFQVVTDHGMYLGMLPAMHDPRQAVSKHPISLEMRKAKSPQDRLLAFQKMFPYLQPQNKGIDDLFDENVVRSAWQEIIRAAEDHNDPHTFTTFIGYEYTSGLENRNLHRNVIFSGSKVPSVPFNRIMSSNPEDLWVWMDDLRDNHGIESLAIPHNSNGSDGRMFQTTTYNGAPIDRIYAATRMRNEPLVEITQVKGDSETHPLLSPSDEWADFEIMPFRVGDWIPSQASGSYVREAYLHGMQMARVMGSNPYKFGLIGATDSHVGAGAFDEDNYWSKVGVVDASPRLRGSVPLKKPRADGGLYNTNNFQTWGASGIAAVWAEENTRDSIYAAMRRKETYATTGPRIAVRFFASRKFADNVLSRPDMVAHAYEKGVSMGSDLLPIGFVGGSPEFLVWAMRDANSHPLQRIQIIKGWLDRLGATHERVYDVACAGGRVPDAAHRCPDNNAQVDLGNCDTSADTGDKEMKVVWQDPDYKDGQSTFYYVRVLENPSCRWSTWDAVRNDVAPRPDIAATVQERAYSSPIWLN
ncbi:MAG: DUF3604 domain-containing protein [Alphaproteobacteria bacterium]|nr:DUF3604 domain-containing protein [Alphaproteobacteria bacterium]